MSLELFFEDTAAKKQLIHNSCLLLSFGGGLGRYALKKTTSAESIPSGKLLSILATSYCAKIVQYRARKKAKNKKERSTTTRRFRQKSDSSTQLQFASN